MSAVETATINEWVVEIYRLTRQDLCIHQVYAICCYDRIIRSHAVLNSRKFHITDNICKFYSISHTKNKLSYPTTK